jgi:hypothetical protein
MNECQSPSMGTNAIQHSTPGSRSLVTWVPSLLREPLIHFLLLGALLFGLHAYLQDSAAPSAQQIVVSAGKIEHLSAIFSKTWQRPPTEEELQGLIDDYILEEVAYREGKAIGLDQDDTIIRRRIRQKLDFFAEDLASQTEPTEAQLAEFFETRRASYATDARLSLRQIFFDPERHDIDLEQEIAAMVEKLEEDPAIGSPDQGDRSLLEYQYQDVSQREIESIFGYEFAAKVTELPVQIWQGPVRSAFGLHVVIVDQRQSGRLLGLDEVRDAVRRDWEHLNRQALADNFYRGLKDKYQVSIEWPNMAQGEE